MQQFALDHPSGPQFQLDWYDDNSKPSDDQLGSILADDLGMPPATTENTQSTSAAVPSYVPQTSGSIPRSTVRPAIDDGMSGQFQLASGGQSGTRLAPYAQSVLDRYDNAPLEPKDTTLIQEKQRFRPSLVSMLKQYGTMDQIRQAPPNVRATLYALTQIGDPAYGLNGTVTDPDLPKVGSGAWKCNVFASKCWARGGGLGYNVNGSNPSGYPTYPQSGVPPTADDIYTNAYNMSNFTHTAKPHVGDIFAFHGNPNQHGHSGIFLGGNLGIYAGTDGVKIGTLPYIQQDDGYTVSPRYRTYTPGH